MVVLHYELVISTLLRKIFLGVCGFFLRNVDGFFGDVEWLKVKRYLFFWLDNIIEGLQKQTPRANEVIHHARGILLVLVHLLLLALTLLDLLQDTK